MQQYTHIYTQLLLTNTTRNTTNSNFGFVFDTIFALYIEKYTIFSLSSTLILSNNSLVSILIYLTLFSHILITLFFRIQFSFVCFCIFYLLYTNIKEHALHRLRQVIIRLDYYKSRIFHATLVFCKILSKNNYWKLELYERNIYMITQIK